MIINPYKLYTPRGIGNLIEQISPRLFEESLGVFNKIKDMRYKNKIKRTALSTGLFSEVSIETINKCNGSCSFCPTNRLVDTRPLELMEQELFYSIINQLKNLKYKGVVSLHGNNEALLDSRTPYFLLYAKKYLPEARLILCTNGSLLTPEKFYKIIPNLYLLIINNYSDNLELSPNIGKIHDICTKDIEYTTKVWIYLRKQHEILTTRAGNAKNRLIPSSPLKSPCIYPFWQIAVRPSGRVSLCCNDALGQETLGDLNTESIIGVWYGRKYNEIRKELLKGRGNLKLCKHCDTLIGL